MLHAHFTALRRRADETKARFRRCLAPAAIAVLERLVVRPGAVHQVELDLGVHARRNLFLTPGVLAVDEQPVGALADGAALAADNGQAEKLVLGGRCIGAGAAARPANAGGVLEGMLVVLRGEAPRLPVRAEIGFAVAGPSLQADPERQFGAIEMSMRVEGHGGRRAVLEFQKG